MKINYNELLKKDFTYMDAIKGNALANIINQLTERNLDLIITNPLWITEQSFDMTVSINGKELNPSLLLENLVNNLTNKDEEIEKFKEKWKSKKSSASRLNRLNEQMSQVKNILNNIENNIKEIK